MRILRDGLRVSPVLRGAFFRLFLPIFGVIERRFTFSYASPGWWQMVPEYKALITCFRAVARVLKALLVPHCYFVWMRLGVHLLRPARWVFTVFPGFDFI